MLLGLALHLPQCRMYLQTEKKDWTGKAGEDAKKVEFLAEGNAIVPWRGHMKGRSGHRRGGKGMGHEFQIVTRI